MSAVDMIERARQIRHRLLYPPNAVPDIGIDLRRHRKVKEPELPPTPPPIAVIEPPTVPLVASEPPENHKLTASFILKVVCDYFNVGPVQIRSHTRLQEVVDTRHILMYLLYRHIKWTKNRIARWILKDHTTVIHGIRKVEFRMASEPDYATMLADLESRFTFSQNE